MADATALRIALIASSFAPHVGGVEEHVAQIAREMSARGHMVEVWAVDRGVRPHRPLTGHDGAEISVRYLPTPLPARSPKAMLRFATRWPTAWRAWRRAHRRLRPDVLHVHCFGPNGIYADALRRRYRTPLVLTSHGETLGDDSNVYARSALLRDRLRRAIASASAVTTPSRYVLDDLRAHYGLRAGNTVPNGVDLDVRADDISPSGDYLFAVGRLGAAKGFDLLIDAFAQARPPGVRLLIGGDGPEHDALRQHTERAGVGDDVQLLGRLSPEQVAGYMSRATAVVVPSRSEAFGIVALEAWRSGAPLVMTSRGGAAEFVHDGVDGILVDPTDVAALSAALLRVLGDADLRNVLRARARERVSQFTWAAVGDQYQALYDGARKEATQ